MIKLSSERTCRSVWLICVVSVLAAACVDPFRGSNIQLTLRAGVPVPPGEGMTPPEQGSLPADTFFSFYAVEFVFERDRDGNIVVDGDGEPVVADSSTYHVTDFEIRPLIDRDSPCFIEVDKTEFPGLHVTRLEEKLRAETGIDDPLNPPSGADSGRVSDVLNAAERVSQLNVLQNTVKAVTSVSHVDYPAVGTACVADGGDTGTIPPPQCTDAESNRVRLDLCRQFWADHPEHYEGSDKVFTIPLNGDFFGTVEAINPLSGAQIGGAGFFVDEVLTGLDSLLINWQFKDLDGDGQPDFPDQTGEPDRSEIGTLFMQGLSARITRGVIHVPLRHPTVTTISGEAAIFPDLGQDGVNF
ncbi:MAG: hypothetical protein MJE77_29620 [Proteobacteria bacterium]|nr:hypothetical protein [Pseudomonadota bacterium]